MVNNATTVWPVEPIKRVWILGAGFSKPLGGPLIADLLTVHGERLLTNYLRAGNIDQSDNVVESMMVRAFCEHGRQNKYWQHAEDFLNIVETAFIDEERKNASHAYRTIHSILHNAVKYPTIDTSERPDIEDFKDIRALLLAARQAVVADCWTFLVRHNFEHERWRPYKDWVNELTPVDTILTFNYDVVLEVMRQHIQNKIGFVTPTQNNTIHAIRQRQLAPVLKLHGSTHWYHDQDGKFNDAPCDKRPPALGNPAFNPIMGFPGPGKLDMCEKLLSPLWTEGTKAIKEAEEVIFIGYRFPPSDSYSREQLLDALHKGNPRKVITVLGTNSPDTPRLSYLLDRVLRRGVHQPAEAYAEDFLTCGQFSPKLGTDIANIPVR
jgi:hypothetical protein